MQSHVICEQMILNNDLSIFEVTKTEFAFQRALIPSSKFSQIFFRQLIRRNFSICIHHAHNCWITLQYGSHCNGDGSHCNILLKQQRKLSFMGCEMKLKRFINQWLREHVTRQNALRGTFEKALKLS